MPIIKAKRLRVLGEDGKWHDIPAVDNTASAVKYIPQELTDEQKAQARENIGVGSGSGGGIPAITDADEGRVLTASGGVAVWQDLPKYGGTYTVTPEVDTVQTLETAGTYMTNDVTVNAIPDYEVSNEAGGNTFIIGKEI